MNNPQDEIMEKERVLVRDNKGIFLKMFKRKFKKEFEFFEDSFLIENESRLNNFERSIFVVYEKSELLDFLKLEKKGANVMVCLFNKQLHNSLTFLEEIKNLFLIDASKTRTEIFKDLKSYFNNTAVSSSNILETTASHTNIRQLQFENLQRALFFMM